MGSDRHLPSSSNADLGKYFHHQAPGTMVMMMFFFILLQFSNRDDDDVAEDDDKRDFIVTCDRGSLLSPSLKR